MAWTKVEGWAGRVWVGDDGSKTFYIRQYRNGKRWDVSTKCSTLRGAVKELERFESALAAGQLYIPGGSGKLLVLDDALIEKYATWCRVQDSFDPEVSEPHLKGKLAYLQWWKDGLKGKPLTMVKLALIIELLDKQSTARRDRIVAIKHLYTYLRATDQITASDDPTLNRLAVPNSRPEQDTTGKSKVIPEADFRAALPHMSPFFADACRFMASLGCHLTEVIRFLKSGSVEQQEDGSYILGFRHKNGHIHRLRVPEHIGAPAARMKEFQWVPIRDSFYDAIRRACARAEIEPWTPGRFRHTFATTAMENGLDPVKVAVALGHDPRTMLKFYATHAVRDHVQAGYHEAPEPPPAKPVLALVKSA